LPKGLTPAQYTFALAYLENGFKAAAAYLEAHPGVTSATARVEGSRTLADPDVRAFVDWRLEQHWGPLQMRGEEAVVLRDDCPCGHPDAVQREREAPSA
jgi:hypothetical protein